MQAITDICDQGRQIVNPFFKGILDTISTMTGIGGKSAAPISTEVVKKAQQEVSLAKSNIFKNLFSSLSFDRQLIRLAGISGAIAVGLGAYGAHVVMMNDDIPEVQKNSFRTASMYHFFGTFGIVASSMTKYPAVSGTLMAIGTTIFCGACYYYGLTGDPAGRKVAPLGGTTLIAAWISFVL